MQTTSRNLKGASLVMSLLLVGTTAPLQARPPTPPEVVDHVRHRIHSIFGHIGRAIEKATDFHDDDDEVYIERERRERRYRSEDRYYEPVPPPVRRGPAYNEDEEAVEDFYAERDYRRGPDRQDTYIPDYRPDDEYYRKPEAPARRNASPSRADERPQDFEAPSTREVKPAPKPEPSVKTEPSKPVTPPVSTSSSSTDEKLQYAVPVPNKSGFVYPPGMKQEAASMIDVRDMRPGQKVRDPRTGKIFLVP